MLINKVCKLLVLSKHFIIPFAVLSKPWAFWVLRDLTIFLISSIDILWFRESISFMLLVSGNLCFVQLQFFCNSYILCVSKSFNTERIWYTGTLLADLTLYCFEIFQNSSFLEMYKFWSCLLSKLCFSFLLVSVYFRFRSKYYTLTKWLSGLFL